MYCYRHLTKKRQKDEELMFDDVDERRKRRRRRKTKTKTKTKDENVDRKRTEEEKKFFKTNVLVPNKHFWERGRYRSGYTYLFSAGSFVRSLGRSGSVLPWKPSNFQQESPINYQKCPNYEKRNKKTPAKFSDIHLHWLSKTDETNETKRMQLSLRTD
jgi:hypothetical protein